MLGGGPPKLNPGFLQSQEGCKGVIFGGAGPASWRGAETTLFGQNREPNLSYYFALRGTLLALQR